MDDLLERGGGQRGWEGREGVGGGVRRVDEGVHLSPT